MVKKTNKQIANEINEYLLKNFKQAIYFIECQSWILTQKQFDLLDWVFEDNPFPSKGLAELRKDIIYSLAIKYDISHRKASEWLNIWYYSMLKEKRDMKNE